MDQNPQFAQMLADGTAAVDDMVRKIKRKLDHGEDLSNADLMNGYTKVHDLCFSWPSPPEQKHVLVTHFFAEFENAVKDRISEKVIPSLENKEGRALVRQLAEEWTEHKQFTKHLLFMFHSLNNINLVPSLPLPADFISLTLFCDMVWDRFNSTIEKAIRDLIALGWPQGQEAEPDLPSYDKLSDFIDRIRFKTDVPLC